MGRVQAVPPTRVGKQQVTMVSTTTPPPHYRDNASCILPVRVTTKADMVRVVQTFCPDMFSACNDSSDDEAYEKKSDSTTHANNKDPGNCIVRPLSGGLSNELFIVSNDDNDKSVLVRIHPPASEAEIVNREVENRIMAYLSQEGIAPTFYGRFLNGRVEEFYKDYQPLSCHDLPKYASQIAFHLAQVHKRTVPDGILNPNANDQRGGEFLAGVETWLQLAQGQQEATQEKNQQQHDVLDLNNLRQELEWLKQELRFDNINNDKSMSAKNAIAFCHEVVLAHMDCQSLNILTHQGQIKLIDFEYAGMNPRAADMANTFCEYCDMSNLKAKYEIEYPSRSQQDEFLIAYMAHVKPEWLPVLSTERDECLQAMRHEIGRFTLQSHLGWAIWSIVQSHLSTIDFDYIAYAKLRMEGYYYFKSKFWPWPIK